MSAIGPYPKVTEVWKIPEFDPRSGNHFWLTYAGYAVDPSTWAHGEQAVLSEETLVMLSGPACWYCNAPYDRRHPTRRCKGKPQHPDPLTPTTGARP